MSGQCIIVTGAASGIGLACVKRLLQEGARVGALDMRSSEDLVELQKASGGRLVLRTADISHEDACRTAIDELRHVLGPLTGLVCSAGIVSGKALRETTMDHWRKVFAVNVEGTVICMRAVMEEMLASRQGAIVLVSSQLVNGGGRNNVAYVSSKAALLGLVKAAALEFAPYNVRVNAILPGVVDTPLARDNASRQADPEAHRERLRLRHPLGRIGQPEEIADAILYLLSDKTAFMTGAELLIDGGWSIA